MSGINLFCFIQATAKLKQYRSPVESSIFSLKKHLINLTLPHNPLHLNNIKANIGYCLYRVFMITHTLTHTHTKKQNLSIHFVRKSRQGP